MVMEMLLASEFKGGSGRQSALLMPRLLVLTAVAVTLWCGPAARAAITGPYKPEADTLHLWHMNEAAPPVLDAAGTNHLTALMNGAKLGEPSYLGFGSALRVYTGNPDASGAAGQAACLAALPLVDGAADNVSLSYAGPSGAFTYEAILRIDFEPSTDFGAAQPGRGHRSCMQIICADADEPQHRLFQFRLAPIGALDDNTQPMLEFINLNQDHVYQSLAAPIPMEGPDAIRIGGWYHAAVVYNGTPNQPANLKLYWTLLDPGRTAANLIGSGKMVYSLPKECSPDFAIGQTGRQSPAVSRPNNNFVGLIDEVRMSGTARSAVQMMFSGGAAPIGVDPGGAPTLAVAAKGASWWRPAAAWAILAVLLVVIGSLAWLIFRLRRVAMGSRSRR
jgi:hypothetical protein